MTEETLSTTSTSSSTTETPLLRVDNETVTVSDFVRFLRLSSNWSVVEERVKHKILERAFSENEIVATDAETLKAIEHFRLEKKLFTVDSANAWLKQQGITAEDLYTICQDRVRLCKLKQKLFDEDSIRKQFAFQRVQFEKVELYQIVTKKEEKSKEIAALLKDKSSFFELAKFHSEDETTAKLCGYIGRQKRSDLVAEVESKVFSAQEGCVVGPIKAIGMFRFFFVEKFYPPTFDDTTQNEIRNQLFNDWLAHEIDKAHVEIVI
jgi:parvulin-like peptidyl-prolyl isomerase